MVLFEKKAENLGHGSVNDQRAKTSSMARDTLMQKDLSTLEEEEEEDGWSWTLVLGMAEYFFTIQKERECMN